MLKKVILGIVAIGLVAISCSDDDTETPAGVVAGVISGGPFEFDVDGEVDNVSGITIDSEGTGTMSTFVITDEDLNILGLPPTLTALEGVNFDGAGAGTCLIWYLSFNEGLQGAEMGMNAANLSGEFALSNSIEVVRNQVTNAGTLEADPFEFMIDGVEDNVSGIMLDETNAFGTNSTFVITDADLTILGLPPTMEALEGVNFDGAGVGVCLIWHLRFEDDLQGAMMGANAADLTGTFDLSNSITVNRVCGAEAGMITGGPFMFEAGDGTPDFVSGIATDGMGVGTNSTWVITDADANILGLPPTLDALESTNFDGAGAGTCLIWYLRFEGELQNAEVGNNASELMGCFDLSNSIEVIRN